MKTTKVLETNITETNINEVSKILNYSSNNRIAICNANTLVRSVKDSNIRNLIENFTIKHSAENIEKFYINAINV